MANNFIGSRSSADKNQNDTIRNLDNFGGGSNLDAPSTLTKIEDCLVF